MDVKQPAWQKASISNSQGACIEVAPCPAHPDAEVLIRESEDGGNVLSTTRANLAAFIHGVKRGEFDHLVA